MGDDEEDGEFFDLFDGLDENMPGPSEEFSDGLLGELKAGFGESSPDRVELGEAPDAPLFDLGEPEDAPVRTGWWVAAAIAIIGLLAAGLFVLKNSSDMSVTIADETPSESAGTADPEPSTTTAAVAVELAFSTPLGFTEVTSESLMAAFTTTEATVFNATLRSGGSVVETTSGDAMPMESNSVTFADLDASTVYSLEVTLLGPPSVVSDRLEIRTGGDNIELEISELVVADVTATSASFEFRTNLCAVVSLVVLDASDQRELQRVSSEPDAPCGQIHVIATGEPALEPGSDYVVLVDAVASSGDESGAGNSTSESISLRTEE